MTFEEIHKAYWPKVYRQCMGYMNDPDAAKDIAQETFIKSLTISTSDEKGSICVQLDRDTPCGKAVNCKTGELIKPIKVEEIFKGWKYIETPGSPCNSFTADDGIPGNTRYYCSGGYCYPY